MADIIGSLNRRTYVRMSHALNFARYDIGIVAMDIIFAIIAQMQKDAKELDCYHTSVGEIEKVLGRKLNRKSLKNAQQELLTEPIVFAKEKSDNPYPWCKTFDLNSRLGLLTIELHPELKKHLLSLNVFVLGSLTEVLRLDSKYSKRIYFILAQFVALGSFEMSVGVLRNILKLPLSMEDSHGNFKKRVLLPSLEKITKFTTIRVNYSEVKIGRRISDIKFVVYKPRKASKGKSGIGAVEDWMQGENDMIEKIKKSHKSGIGAVEDWLQGKNKKDEAMDAEIIGSLLVW